MKDHFVYFNGEACFHTFVNLSNVSPQSVDRGIITLLAPNVNATGLSISIASGLAATRQISFCYFGSSRIKPEIINYRLQQFFYAIGYNPVPGTDPVFTGINISGNW